MISSGITVMAGRLPDAPFALELVQLESVGVCMQLSGGDRHHHLDQDKDLRYHRLSLRVCLHTALWGGKYNGFVFLQNAHD